MLASAAVQSKHRELRTGSLIHCCETGHVDDMLQWYYDARSGWPAYSQEKRWPGCSSVARRPAAFTSCDELRFLHSPCCKESSGVQWGHLTQPQVCCGQASLRRSNSYASMLVEPESGDTAGLNTLDICPGVHGLLQVMPQDVLQGVA